LYATALAVEHIFPEIGGAYLGSMCLFPADRIHEILRARSSSQPQDSGCQAALSLIELPMQITTSYVQRQRSISSLENYRVSPHTSPYVGSHLPMGTAHDAPPTLYSNSPVQTPGVMAQSGTSYLALPTRRESPSFRNQALGERSMSAGSAMQMYGNQNPYTQPQSRSSHDSTARADYFGAPPASYNYFGGMNTHSRFVAPSQLWT
jgi:hypothetical protein